MEIFRLTFFLRLSKCDSVHIIVVKYVPDFPEVFLLLRKKNIDFSNYS